MSLIDINTYIHTYISGCRPPQPFKAELDVSENAQWDICIIDLRGTEAIGKADSADFGEDPVPKEQACSPQLRT